MHNVKRMGAAKRAEKRAANEERAAEYRAISQAAFERRAAKLYDDESLKAITLPPSLETIEKEAFARCESLKAVTIPESTQVAVGAFRPSTKITRLSAKAMANAAEPTAAAGEKLTA